MNKESAISPLLPSQRIISLDLLRGIAVLGILILNIQSFAMIGAAYSNPNAYGNFTGINKVIWIFNQLIANGKFINLFSILFGAGIILLYKRKIEQGENVWKLQIRRNFWLLCFGMVHAYAIWYGDILVYYSFCGVFVFLFRKLSHKRLFILAGIFFMVPAIFSIIDGIKVSTWSEINYGYCMDAWLPGTEKINEELTAIRGGYLEVHKYRYYQLRYMHTFLFAKLFFWRISSLMLMGMALFKCGILTANKSRTYYARLSLIGILVGTMLSAFGLYKNFHHEWKMEYSMFFGHLYNYFGSIATTLGYIGVVMLIAKSGKMSVFKRAVSSTGKMAFTNYILMSIICGLIFYGYGLGYFGKLERFEQFLFVVLMWGILLTHSTLWLKKYYYGPLEWLWRYLTYGKKPAFKR